VWGEYLPLIVMTPRPSIISLSNKYGHDPLHYPIKALTYAISHPSMWRIVLCVACVGFILSVLILVTLLAVALKPQAELISPDLEWWAWLIAVLVVLLESAVCAGLLLAVSQSRAQTKLFVATMRQEGMWRADMVAQSTVKDLNLVKKAFVVRIVTLPIQIVPIVGGIIYSAINATFTGWDYMDRYFDAIGLHSALQRKEVFGREMSDCAALCNPSTYDADSDYARFGFMCGFLESIPLVGAVLFPLTNAIAAALFACDIERGGGPIVLRGAGNDDEEGRKRASGVAAAVVAAANAVGGGGGKTTAAAAAAEAAGYSKLAALASVAQKVRR